MKVNVEDRSTVKKTLHIEVSEDRVTRELDKAYRELKKTAKVKGFRPGKAPRSVLQRIYGKDVVADVASRLIQETFIEALKETDLKMVGNPHIDPPALEAGSAYAYEATVDVSPEIADIEFKGLKLKRPLYRVSDAEIETQYKMLQRNLAEYRKIDVDRPVESGDHVLIDYEGTHDGQPLEETGRTVNFSMKIGDGQILADFDDHLVGLRPEETRTFSLAFPADYRTAAMAGREIDFEVTLKEIREEVLPPVDDEMARKLGSYQNLEELRTAIIDHLQSGYDKRSEQEMNEQVFTRLIAVTDFELPDALVDFEMENILNDIERRLTMQNLRMEDVGMTREGLVEKYRPTAEKQVRRHLILNKIVEQESLTLNDEQLEAGYQDLAKNYNQPVEGIKSFYSQNRDKEELFRHTLLEKQAIDLILNHSEIEEVEPEQDEGSANDPSGRQDAGGE